MDVKTALRSILLPAALLVAASCGFLKPRPDLTNWFVLATIEELDGSAPAALGIGPLSFPEYVLRRELVSREGTTGIAPLSHERWAEPLEDAAARVLASDLTHLTGARPVPHPWFAAEAPAVRVRVDFARFELVKRASAVLDATWTLEDVESGAVLTERRSQIVRPLTVSPEASVGPVATHELSRALADLSAEIAESWKALPAAGERSP